MSSTEIDYRLHQLYASNEPASYRVYPPVKPVLPGTSQTNLLAETQIKALQTNVTDMMDAGSTGNSSASQSSNSL